MQIENRLKEFWLELDEFREVGIHVVDFCVFLWKFLTILLKKTFYSKIDDPEHGIKLRIRNLPRIPKTPTKVRIINIKIIPKFYKFSWEWKEIQFSTRKEKFCEFIHNIKHLKRNQTTQIISSNSNNSNKNYHVSRDLLQFAKSELNTMKWGLKGFQHFFANFQHLRWINIKVLEFATFACFKHFKVH